MGIFVKGVYLEYYVYSGSLSGAVVYVGKGRGNRYLHLNSGKSSCYQANKLHFEGGSLIIKIVEIFENSLEAEKFERDMIREIKPIWNILYNTDSSANKLGKKPPNSSSIYLGVGFSIKGIGGKLKPLRQWRATYNAHGKKINIGFYSSEIEAALARDKYIIDNNIGLPLNFP